ncbi:MAG TPA: signal peptidase I [Phycisphaerales bacterium]|nr:signal peptidase I [Phycisphaerales bacterium]
MPDDAAGGSSAVPKPFTPPPPPPSAPSPGRTTPATPAHPKESVKETIISVIIAFAMAFVFRSFVAEAFIIPTGSMAPTLNGAHMRFVSPYTGEDWAVSPWFFIDNNSQNPYPSQGDEAANRIRGAGRGVTVHDPVTGLDVFDQVGKARAGDRIFVLKYLYGIQSPEPYDVVVFKNPTQPDENYIKRLIALPGEQVALVDGDVFVRPAPKEAGAGNPWEGKDWTIRRKPEVAQRAVWLPVYDSSLMTAAAVSKGAQSPWVAGGGATAADGGAVFKVTAAPSTIAWDRTKPFVLVPGNPSTADADRTREINDRYAYNEAPGHYANQPRFPVGDIRVRATAVVRKDQSDVSAMKLDAVIEARGHEFRASIAGGRAVLTMRPLAGGEARVVAEGDAGFGRDGRPPGGPVPIEFWHSDQRLELYVNGERVASGGYDWLPMERLRNALTPGAWEQFTGKAPTRSGNILADAASYVTSSARLEVSGAEMELRAVALDRDLFYRPATYPSGPTQRLLAGTPGAATHPSSTLTLKDDQYFVCGDNSPSSLDARLWGYPDPWVAEEFDASPSVVSRRLLMGKAFFVYFPSPVGGSPVGVPDFGRLRAIR